MPEGLFYGPRQYQPNAGAKLSSLKTYLKVAPYVLPEQQITHSSVRWMKICTRRICLLTRKTRLESWASLIGNPSVHHHFSCRLQRHAFLDREALNAEEWTAWMHALAFVDHEEAQ